MYVRVRCTYVCNMYIRVCDIHRIHGMHVIYMHVYVIHSYMHVIFECMYEYTQYIRHTHTHTHTCICTSACAPSVASWCHVTPLCACVFQLPGHVFDFIFFSFFFHLKKPVLKHSNIFRLQPCGKSEAKKAKKEAKKEAQKEAYAWLLDCRHTNRLVSNL